ncbi:MAG: class I SAM-dependent methyltransferase [Verrucomicrobia bacterium]|nr:class I SAM-dependent methyltransferase [Verrucomicrobiota bacterium]
MELASLKLLHCPFCGGQLKLEQSAALEMVQGRLQTGLLGCACCAYPVVAGIPYLRTGQTARAALGLLDVGKADEALFTLLGLEGRRREQFEALRRDTRSFTCQQALEILSPNPEGNYFLYRFSDPTFLVSESLLYALSQDTRCTEGRMLDLCGGAGHLTRTLCNLAPDGEVWLADLEFWKLWLAKQFVAPECRAICCDAALPLPFARRSFSLIVCADALHYVWPRRLAAGEMTRLVGREGAIVVTALHNALCENASAGSPLEPADWRGLFEEIPARLFAESAVLNAILADRPIALSLDHADAELATEPTLIAIASELEGLFRDYQLPGDYPFVRRPVLNPLYRRADNGSANSWTLQFPSPEYAEEFAACRRYLPERLTLTESQVKGLNGSGVGEELRELARRRVVLDLPENYL